MKTKILSSLLLITLSFGIVCSQNLNKPKLDSLFKVLGENNKAMGSVAISKNGQVIYTNAIGFSFISETEKKPATINTKYRIGSITKMFTATMIFQLVEEGKIKLTTPLSAYFPAIPNADKITIGNLLNHRSGLHNLTDDPDYLTYMTQAKTQEQMLAIISRFKVDFEPNAKAAYSNSNYVILGYIIEKITKQPYAKNLSQRITSKIQLINTYVGRKTTLMDDENYSYKYINNWQQEPETDMSIPGGAGAIVSTPTDLTRFIESLFSLKLVSQNSLDQMKTITDGYGMGMFQFPFETKKAFGHNGGIDGFASNLSYFPEEGVSVAYCTNAMVYPMNSILLGVLSICFDRPYVIPTFNTIDLKEEDLVNYLGIYSSTQIPLKITISRNGMTLTAQATGQSAFPLEATGKDQFKFDQAGVVMEFKPETKEMTLKQGGGVFQFTKGQ